jgi:hypothetical protein
MHKAHLRAAALNAPAANGYEQGFNPVPFNIGRCRLAEEGFKCFALLAVHAGNFSYQ